MTLERSHLTQPPICTYSDHTKQQYTLQSFPKKIQQHYLFVCVHGIFKISLDLIFLTKDHNFGKSDFRHVKKINDDTPQSYFEDNLSGFAFCWSFL